jgi:Flp pilus assembly pilin Flp
LRVDDAWVRRPEQPARPCWAACVARFLADERGAESTEVAAVALAMAVTAVVAVGAVGDAVDARATQLAKTLRAVGR